MRNAGSSYRILSAFLIFLVLAFSCFRILSLNVAADPRRIIVPDDYSTIQAAVNSALAGDIIFVRNGTYFENIVIDKGLTLNGENSSSTIVDGSGSGSVFTVAAGSVRISNFTIRNSGIGYPNGGIRVLDSFWWCTFRDNILTDNFVGVLLSSSSGNLLERNQILRARYGFYLLNSPGNRMLDNIIMNNYAGCVMLSSSNCHIIGNDISNNTVGISMSGCSGNLVYNNNFTRNDYPTSLYSGVYYNTWDNGYPQGGNYWSNYRGRDLYKGPYQNVTGSDGIGDIPHVIEADNVDRFPYMNPLSVFHDVAVLSVVPSAFKAYQGEVLNISVVVANLGTYNETIGLSVYCINDSNETIVGTRSVANLVTHDEMAVAFEWNTSAVEPGEFTIRAQTTPVEGEKDFSNNVLYNGTVTVTERFHDVAVLSVVPSAFKVNQGEVLNISVVVANLGNYTETFNLTTYYDESVVGRQNVANLGIGMERTLVFSWNTTGVESNREYSIRAEATGIVDEANLDNNGLVDGSVRVRSPAFGAIGIAQLVPSDHLGNPLSSFSKGAISYFKVAVNSTSVDSEIVLVTANVYDSSSTSLGVVSFKGLIMPGVSVFILGLPIPNAAHTGTAKVYANTLTDWPFAGGLPYNPEKSATFQISG